MSTYQERVLRYRVVRHTEYPEDYKVSMREAGIDPDDNWSLVWSFNDEASALTALAEEQVMATSKETYKIIDNGTESFIERQIW